MYFIIYKYKNKILKKYNLQVIYNKHTFLLLFSIYFGIENYMMVYSKSKEISTLLSTLKMV